MTATVARLIEQVKALPPEDRGELRAWMNATADSAADGTFAQKLVELNIGHPRADGPRDSNPLPVHAAGRPLSELLIEERR
jgi:hypothetical protein